jgi:Mn2+/Fe2+ NRAMP family transporter
MRWFHLIVGLAMFVSFTVTGQYMRADFPDKETIPQEFRLLMRSRHIYILFSALIHLSLAAYLKFGPVKPAKILQFAGSVLLLISSVYLVWAFIVETYSAQTFTDLSRSGIHASLAGVVLHLIGGLAQKHER